MELAPSLHDAMDDLTARAIAEIGADGVQPGSLVWGTVSKLVGIALTPGNVPSLDSLFNYVAMAHGLHAASASVRASGNLKFAEELHGMGQLFLCYATGDIEKLNDLAGLIFTPEKAARIQRVAEFHCSEQHSGTEAAESIH